MLWRRSLVQPIRLGEVLLLVALLAFCRVLPVFLIPACCEILLLVLIGWA